MLWSLSFILKEDTRNLTVCPLFPPVLRLCFNICRPEIEKYISVLLLSFLHPFILDVHISYLSAAKSSTPSEGKKEIYFCAIS